MVLIFTSDHNYDYNFATVSTAFFNRYPNPYATHVISADTISQYIDENQRLHTTRLLRKEGRLPQFLKPFLGKINESWIVEFSIVDSKNSTMETWTSNLEHTGVLKVQEHTVYSSDSNNSSTTSAKYNVSFISNFGRWAIKDRIENWSYKRFGDNIMRSRRGMAFVMEHLREKGVEAFQQMNLANVIPPPSPA